MTIQTDERTPEVILRRVDAIVDELLTLRRDLQSMVRQQSSDDIVEELAGSLGPASDDEMQYFKSLDIQWQRFQP